jgi:hypothetical protein
MNNIFFYVTAMISESRVGLTVNSDLQVDRGQLFGWSRLYVGLYLNLSLSTINNSSFDSIFFGKTCLFEEAFN